jgi:hypothetical protein
VQAAEQLYVQAYEQFVQVQAAPAEQASEQGAEQFEQAEQANEQANEQYEQAQHSTLTVSG